MIRVELYEGARRIAGVAQVEVDAGTLGGALAAVAALHPELTPRVIAGNRLAHHWRASINGRRFVDDPETALKDGDAIVIVSALAGG